MNPLGPVVGRRLALPDDPNRVTRIDRAAECDPQDAGMDRAGVERIWSAVEAMYRTRLHPSVTLVLRRHGRLVIKRAIGHARPEAIETQSPLDPDAPQSLFSASKLITALLVHKLAEHGRLSLEDRVADHIPAFGQHGKGGITVRDLLAHRAGVPHIPREHADPSLLDDWDQVIRLICEQPLHHPDSTTQAYHALTSGFIAGELVRRAGDIELRDALREWIAAPLGCRYMTYGAEPWFRAQRARNAFTGPKPPWPLSIYFRRILGLPFKQAIDAAETDTFLSTVIPAGNIYASADDLSRLMEMLRSGGTLDGTRILEPETVRELRRPVGRIRRDRTLHFPIRYSAGCMLGENPVGLYGPRCGLAFGHLGFISILGWADPQRGVSAALLNTGKHMALDGLLRMEGVLWAINRTCRPV